jgi:hypothetical protein
MTSIDSLILDQEYHSPSYIKHLQDEIKDSITWFDSEDFVSWSKRHNFAFSKTGGHPLEEAHQSAFKYMKENHAFTC